MTLRMNQWLVVGLVNWLFQSDILMLFSREVSILSLIYNSSNVFFFLLSEVNIYTKCNAHLLLQNYLSFQQKF